MAVTLIKTKAGLLKYRTFFLSNGDVEFFVEVSLVNEDLKPSSNAIKYAFNGSEKEFHMELREKASLKEHLITSHSTNPEWNPENYIKNLK